MNYTLKDLERMFPGKWMPNGHISWYLCSKHNPLEFSQITYIGSPNVFYLYNKGSVGDQTSNLEVVKTFYKQHFKFLNFK